MALQHLRSSTANKRPDPAAMADGQLALNTANASPGLFYKDATGSLIKAGPVHIGSSAPNATPASGGHPGNSVGEAWLDTSGSNPLLKIWNGSNWQTVQPVASGTVVSTADTGTVTSTMIANGTIVNADINASAAIVDTKLATISTIGKVSNSATTATSANTASAIVARDASGNFSAGTITANLTGTASAIANDSVTNAKVASNAAIAFSKLATLSSANILIGSSSNVATSVAMTGDVTISNTGVTAIASGVIVDADVNASAAIAGTKINPDFGNQVVDTTALNSFANLMIAFALRGNSIGTPGQPLFGIGPAVTSATPVGIGPHDYYPIDLSSGSFM